MNHLPATNRAMVGRFLACAILLLLVVVIAVPMLGSDSDRGGDAPYTPTRGEWLCLVLNTQRALVNSEQEPLSMHVRYLYDRSKPNTIQIELLFGADIPRVEIRRRAEDAERGVREAARIHGWDRWLAIDFKETQLTGSASWENLYR